MSTKKEPTFSEVINQAISACDGAVSVEELARRAMDIRMPAAKDPRKSMLKHIKEERGRSLIYLDKKTALPIRLAYNNIRFRLEVSRQFVKTGLLLLNAFANYYTQILENPSFVDKKGKKIEHTIEEKTEKEKTFWGKSYEIEKTYVNLKAWVKKEKPTRKDHLLVSILDWEKAIFQLEIEPYKKRNIPLLKKRDKLLADTFFDILEHERHETSNLFQAIPSAYARLPEKDGYPPHRYRTVIRNDKRMVSDGFQIEYSDGERRSLFSSLSDDLYGKEEAPKVPMSDEIKESVYLFKAQLKHAKRIWRKIEIKGGQTLESFAIKLVYAFEHDPDHLSAFWKLVRRGNTKRFREVEVAKINRFERSESEGADTPIGTLELKPGDRLKFVHDFGDWYEHIVELKEIKNAEQDVEYPRVVAQNKARHRYCTDCKKEGEKTVAIYGCYTCFEEQGKNVLICEDCAEKYHEEHYLEEILY